MINLLISFFFVILSLFLLYLATRNIFSIPFITGLFLALTFIGCSLISGFSSLLSFYFSLSMFFLALGVLGANKIKRFSPSFELRKIREIEISSLFKLGLSFSLALSSLIFLNILAVSYLFLKSGIPFFAKIPEVAKVEIAFGSNWLLVRSLRIFLPVLLLVLFLYTFKTKRLLAKLGFIFLFCLVGVIYLFYGYKGYFLVYIITPFVALYPLLKKVKPREVILLVFLALLIIIPLYINMLKTTNPIEIFNAINNRLTVAQAEGVSYIVNNLVPTEGLFYGRTFKMDISGLLHKVGILKKRSLNFNAFLVEHKTGSNPQGRVQMASTLFGEFYANFGVWGGILGVFLAGFLLQLLYIKAIRSSKNIFFLPLIIFIQAALSSAINSGHTLITLVDMGVCTLFILFLLIIFYIFFGLPSGKIIFIKRKYANRN